MEEFCGYLVISVGVSRGMKLLKRVFEKPNPEENFFHPNIGILAGKAPRE